MFIWFPIKTENSSASGSAGTLVFMILLIFRNSKLDQWETLLSWPVVQLANTDIEICQIHQQINPLRYLVSRVKLSSWWCSQMQTSEIWQILTKKLNKFNTLSSEQSQSVKLVVLANAKRWNLTNTVEKLNKSNASWEQKRSGNPVVAVEWL